MLRTSVFGLAPLLAGVTDTLPSSYYLNAQNSGLLNHRLSKFEWYAVGLAHHLGCSQGAAERLVRYILHVLCTYERILVATADQVGVTEQDRRTRDVLHSAVQCMGSLLAHKSSLYQCANNLCPVCRALKMAHVLSFITVNRVKTVPIPLEVKNGALDVSRRYRPPTGTKTTLRVLQICDHAYTSLNHAFCANTGDTFTSIKPFVASSCVPHVILTDALASPLLALQHLTALRVVGMHATARSTGCAWASPEYVISKFPEINHDVDVTYNESTPLCLTLSVLPATQPIPLYDMTEDVGIQ